MDIDTIGSVWVGGVYGLAFIMWDNVDGHGIVADGFDLEIRVDAQFPCTVLVRQS